MKQSIANKLVSVLARTSIDPTVTVTKLDKTVSEILRDKLLMLDIADELYDRIKRKKGKVKVKKIHVHVTDYLIIFTYKGRIYMTSQISDGTGYKPTKLAVEFLFKEAMGLCK